MAQPQNAPLQTGLQLLGNTRKKFQGKNIKIYNYRILVALCNMAPTKNLEHQRSKESILLIL
jgi:hypothetical protein